MDIHKNARLTPQSRALLVSRIRDDGWTVAEASHAAGVSERTGWKWLARFREEGLNGLYDRSSRPRRSRGTTTVPAIALTCSQTPAAPARSGTADKAVHAQNKRQSRAAHPNAVA